ncbi:S8 family serine peptidase [Streptomyces xiamenensis]|uniref:S8 family serine peptidase n=1 Tax=Streptomyces xiamenensis TaxID=408015 RepID=UPI0036E6C473
MTSAHPARGGTAAAAARRRAAILLGLTAALTLAPLTPLAPPGTAGTALAAEPCRQEVTGADLPDGGPHPLIDLLGLRQTWDLATGAGVTVAVVDSGVDARHPDLADAVVTGSEYVMVPAEQGFARSTPAPEQDCEGHGTAVAGLIAADRTEGDRMTGVAPDAAVYPVRVADGVDRASFETLAAAIDDAVDSGAAVVNLSFAIPGDREPVREAVERAVDAGVLVIAAAGNEGNRDPSQSMYPAAYDGVLAVAAVDGTGAPMQSSNAAEWVDLAAYGENLPVVAPGGSGYRGESGTSFAAAQVSGAAALVLSRFPELSADEVAQRLIASASPVGGGRNDLTGAGIVDPFGAVTGIGLEGGGAAGDTGETTPGRIPVQAVPRPEPALSGTAVTALAVSGGLLLSVVLGLLAAPAVRRAARRGWHPGPLDTAPEGPPAGHPPPRPPAGTRLDWLDGTDLPPAAARSTGTPAGRLPRGRHATTAPPSTRNRT